ncbi:Kiwa anti-phage protein KwaB-like domain-containing protein [Acinetobacter sp. P8-3-8]|uniref:Kiwa anti-phage protein KwaB-like domain-containing protein n=1 Tax=Acinetobacter sp. P8-3-8 TaxID=1029823 RepID=UPI0002486057|nr:Kiwa anti-phage protein KwaB-like domain-containing protein [Acinetobacter sp. P8-3-8]
MVLDFDFDNIKNIEFGVGRELEDQNQQFFEAVPVDVSVQKALVEMAKATVEIMNKSSPSPDLYQPSEKHAGIEYLYLPISDQMAQTMKDLHEALNLPINSKVLKNPTEIFCYFARFSDQSGKKLTALRRATQFKGVLKNKLISVCDDTLKIVEEKVFKLDADFDLLIDNSNIHIIRPSAFEFAGRLQEAILQAVPANITSIAADINYVDFTSIQAYAEQRPRAARYIASIKSQVETKNINKDSLKSLCENTGVGLTIQDGKFFINGGSELGFLEVLDRRRYRLELIDGKAENFKASSRSKL